MSIFKTVYLVDVGVLYTDKDEETESYFSVYDHQYGYYDENQFYVLDKNKAINFVNNYVNNGVDMTYGIVSKTEIAMDIDEEEIEDLNVEGEDYLADDVVYSIAKINNKITEHFIKN